MVTRPPDPLPPTMDQWCVILSRSVIGGVVVVIPAAVGAVAAVAPLSPTAPPDWRLLRRHHHCSPPPLLLPTAISTSSANY